MISVARIPPNDIPISMNGLDVSMPCDIRFAYSLSDSFLFGVSQSMNIVLVLSGKVRYLNALLSAPRPLKKYNVILNCRFPFGFSQCVASTPYRTAASSISIFISFSVLNLMQYPVTLALPIFFPYVWAKYFLSSIPRI